MIRFRFMVTSDSVGLGLAQHDCAGGEPDEDEDGEEEEAADFDQSTSQTLEDPDQPGTGWVRFNGMDAPIGWAWDEVHSNDHDSAVVNWTLGAGEHTLEIAKREDGTLVDAILITDDLALDQATLP